MKKNDPKRIVADGYDKIGSAYRPWADAHGGEVRHWFLRETLARIPRGADVLELGCGPGVDAVALAEGRRYTGIDLSPVMLALAKKRLPGATLLQADLAHLDVPAGSFDAVVALYVFGHVPAIEHAPMFARIFRWLRPGGVFCSSLPLGNSEGVEDDWLGVPMFFGGIGRDATEIALGEIGFALEIADVKVHVEEDGSTESFFWTIARKPTSSTT